MAPTVSTNESVVPGASNEAVPSDAWERLYVLASQCFDYQRYLHCPNLQDRVALTASFISMASSVREYAIGTQGDLAMLWGEIRKDTRYLDCIMGASGQFLLSCGFTVRTMAEALAISIHAICPGDENTRLAPFIVADFSFRESLGEPDTLQSLLEANPWFLVFILIKRSGILTLVSPRNDGSESGAA